MTQLGFGAIGVDPTHWHVVQGFTASENPDEVRLSDHRTQEKARDQLSYDVIEVGYAEDVDPTSSTEDRADFDVSSVTGFSLGWIRVADCDDWSCYLGCEKRAWEPWYYD